MGGINHKEDDGEGEEEEKSRGGNWKTGLDSATFIFKSNDFWLLNKRDDPVTYFLIHN